jgi:hypothetical protein
MTYAKGLRRKTWGLSKLEKKERGHMTYAKGLRRKTWGLSKLDWVTRLSLIFDFILFLPFYGPV